MGWMASRNSDEEGIWGVKRAVARRGAPPPLGETGDGSTKKGCLHSMRYMCPVHPSGMGETI